MGLLSGLMKAGVAKKVYDEARKPHNQAKAKDLYRSMRGGKGQQPGDGPPDRLDGPSGPTGSPRR